MKKRYHTAVIGLGSVGLAAAAELSSKGVSVIGFDRFSFYHNKGSHCGHTRLIRQAYFEHPSYVPLLKLAFKKWANLEQFYGKQIYFPTGLFYRGPSAHKLMLGVIKSSRLFGVKIDQPDKEKGGEILFESNAGFLDTYRALHAFKIQAEANGAVLHFNEGLVRWSKKSDRFVIVSGNRTVEVEKIVFSSGSWLTKTLTSSPTSELDNSPGAEDNVKITEQWIGWYEKAKDKTFKNACWGVVDKYRDGLLYGFPQASHLPPPYNDLYKVAIHSPSRVISPEEKSSKVFHQQESEAIRERLDEYFPGEYGQLKMMQSCLYTNSPDGNFLLGYHPYDENIIIAGGMSGHGFKFLPATAHVISSLIFKQDLSFDISFLSPGRFTS